MTFALQNALFPFIKSSILMAFRLKRSLSFALSTELTLQKNQYRQNSPLLVGKSIYPVADKTSLFHFLPLQLPFGRYYMSSHTGFFFASDPVRKQTGSNVFLFFRCYNNTKTIVLIKSPYRIFTLQIFPEISYSMFPETFLIISMISSREAVSLKRKLYLSE